MMFDCKLTLTELRELRKVGTSETMRQLARAEASEQIAADFQVSDEEAIFLYDLKELAAAQSALSPIPRRLGYCHLCKSGPGEILYKSGRQKGRVKSTYDKPGYEFRESFVSFKGRAFNGCCAPCFERLRPHLAKIVEGLECEISEKITGHPNRFKRYRNRKCTKCGWVGHEGEMLRQRTMMGDGWFPAGCPSCKAENAFLSVVVELADGYTVVPVPMKDGMVTE